MSDAIEIQVTCGSADEAETIADALIVARLAACVQQLPIRSTYRWEGRVERDDEVLLLVKTAVDRYDAVAAEVLTLHSYDVPAITAVAFVAGSREYLDWIVGETRP